MITAWTKHIKDPKKKQDLERDIRGSKWLLELLSQVLKEEEERLDRSELNVKAFDNPNWAYLQAYKNGYKSSLNVVQNLINLDHKKEQ